MNITVEHLPKNRASIRVELTSAEMLPYLNAASVRLSSRSAFPGFRPGKAPYDVVAQRLGEGAVWEEALEDAVRESFVKAIKDHQLTTVGHPDVKVEKVAPGNPVIYVATVALMPSVKLPESLVMDVKKTVDPVSDQDIDKTVDELRNMLATEKPVERAAQNGDRIEIDVDVSIDGVTIEGGKTRKHPAILGKGSFIPGFEDQVVGMTKGTAKEFELTFPKDYYAKHLAGKKALFKVTVQSIAERVLPTLDDDFVQKVSRSKNVAELREELRKNILSEHEEKANREYEAKLIEAVVKKSTFGDIPDLLIENEMERMMSEIRYDAEQRGMKFEDYLSSLKKDEEGFKKELTPSAINRVKSTLVIRTIAEAEKIAVSEDELTKEISEAEASARDDHQREQFRTEEFRRYVETMLINRKAVDALRTKQPTA